MGLFSKKKKGLDEFEDAPAKAAKPPKAPKQKSKGGKGKIVLLLLLLLPVLAAGGAFGYFMLEKGNRASAAEAVLRALPGASWAESSYNLDVLGFYQGDQGYLTVSGFALKGTPFSFSASVLMMEQGRTSKKGKEVTFAAKNLYLENVSIGAAGMKEQGYSGKFSSVDLGGFSMTFGETGITKLAANTAALKGGKSKSQTPFGEVEQTIAFANFSKLGLDSVGKGSMNGISIVTSGIPIFSAKSISFDSLDMSGPAPQAKKLAVKDAKMFGGSVKTIAIDTQDGWNKVDILGLALSPEALRKINPRLSDLASYYETEGGDCEVSFRANFSTENDATTVQAGLLLHKLGKIEFSGVIDGETVTDFKGSIVNNGMFAAIFGDKLEAVSRMVGSSGLSPIEPFLGVLEGKGRLDASIDKVNLADMPEAEYSATFKPKE